MMIASRLISLPSFQAVAESYIANRGCEECNRHHHENQILHASSSSLKLEQYGEVQAVFRLAKVRRKPLYQRSRRSLIAARGRHASRSGEIRHTRRAMVVLPPESNVLTGHVIE